MHRRPTFQSIGLRCFLMLVTLLSSSTLFAQTNMMLDGDLRVFTVVAALNAAGFDYETSPAGMHPLRVAVRNRLQQLDPTLKQKLKEFYETHRGSETEATLLSQYISLALVLSGAPQFKLILPTVNLPPDVLPVLGFEALVREFYEKAPVAEWWAQAQPAIEAEITRYQRPVIEALQFTDGYLRLPMTTYLGRKYNIVIDLLLPFDQRNARNYGEDYYLVLGPTKTISVEEIRHQYLHFILDPLALRAASLFRRKAELLSLATRNEALPADFRKDFLLFATECLINAIELRSRRLSADKAEESLDRANTAGFFLTRYFYEALANFEQEESSFRESFPDLIGGLDVEKEKKRFRPPMAPPRKTERAKTEIEKRLAGANVLIADGKYELAKKQFQELLDQDESVFGQATYGLGVVALLQGHSEKAKENFQKVKSLPAVDAHTRCWTHIYLGRILDLEQARDQALQEYAAGARVCEEGSRAQQLAKEGLLQPYQGADRRKK